MSRANLNSTFPELVAPCGIDCGLCHAYVRDKNICPGCRGEDVNKSKSCVTCAIKNCEKRMAGKLEYCFECEEFPCKRIQHLDQRYRRRYATSVIDNLQRIQSDGIQAFIENESKVWACPECGALLCMHKPRCLSCGYTWR